MKKAYKVLLMVMAVGLMMQGVGWAELPQYISFQGKFDPKPTSSVTFTLGQGLVGGTDSESSVTITTGFWSKTFTPAQLKMNNDGLFDILLGPISASVIAQTAQTTGRVPVLAVGMGETLIGVQQLANVPFAVHAVVADSLSEGASGGTWQMAGNNLVYLNPTSGNVGIGTSAPTNDLHIHKTGALMSPYIKLTNNTTGQTVNDGLKFGIDDAGHAELANYEAGRNIKLSTQGNGIIKLATNSVQISSVDGNINSWFPWVNGSVYLTGNRDGGGGGDIYLRSYGATGGEQNKMIVKGGTGDVGIGTIVPKARLHIEGDGTDQAGPLLLLDGATDTEGDLAWPDDEVLQLGTLHETTKLFTKVMEIASSSLSLKGSGDTGINVEPGGTTGGASWLRLKTTHVFPQSYRILAGHGGTSPNRSLRIYDDNEAKTRLSIDRLGHVHITQDGDMDEQTNGQLYVKVLRSGFTATRAIRAEGPGGITGIGYTMYGLEGRSTDGYGLYATSTNNDAAKFYGPVTVQGKDNWAALKLDGSGTWMLNAHNSGKFYLRYNSSGTITSSDLQFKFESDGKLTLADVVQTSSLRYKDNIAPLRDPFSQILKLEPKEFTWKKSGKRDIGYIAEEVDALGLNKLVSYNEQGQPDALNYDKISIYLLEVIKGLKTENAEMKARIEALESKVK